MQKSYSFSQLNMESSEECEDEEGGWRKQEKVCKSSLTEWKMESDCLGPLEVTSHGVN